MTDITLNVNDVGCSAETLFIGYQGENGVTLVTLDYSAWVKEFGPGEISLEIMRSGDTVPYLATISAENETAKWLISDVDTGARGQGAAGFVYRVEGKVKKSAVFRFFVGRDVGGTPGERPDPYESLITYMERLLAETKENADAAAGSATDAADSASTAAEQAAAAAAAQTAAQIAQQGAEAAQAAAEVAQGKAETAEQGAEAAQAAAEAAQGKAETAEQGAEAAQAGAEAAKQAIEDMGVTAHEDPNGPSVEKSVDPDTGAVTLDFGFKPAGVKSVNGKTGEIELTLDDIPDGEAYARTTPAQVRQIGTNADDIDAIEAKIPPQASATNQLADKDFVNSSINSSTAFFRGSFATHAALFAVPWQTTNPAAANYVTNNDYAYVADDETHSDEAWRYIYVLQPGGTGNGWQPQFKVNDSPLTAAQLAALNSGATAENIAAIAEKYVKPATGIPLVDLSQEVAESLSKADTAYQLPAAGIPKTDLAAGVQQSLDKADTALQEHQSLAAYRTAAAQDVIDAAQDVKIAVAAQATEETTVGPAAIASFDASAADMPLKSLLVNIEPVQAGSGDPSPENIRPISGHTGCNVTKTGKNLFSSEIEQGVIYNSGRLDGSPTRVRTKDFIPIRSGGQYTISLVESGVIIVNCLIYDADKNLLRAYSISASSFICSQAVTDGGAFAKFSFSKSNTSSNISPSELGNVQLEVGPTATSFEPYQGNTYNITFPSEAGTVYGGTLDVTNGVLTVSRISATIARIDEQGSTSVTGKYRWAWKPGNIKPDSNIMCDQLPSVSNSATYITSEGISVHPTNGNIYIYIDAISSTTIQGANAYFAEHPLQVVYELKPPITYRLTPQEITTLLGTNNIWADTGDVTVTYGAYLETIKAHADRLGDSILSAIAPLETTYTASRAYTVGSYLFVGTKFFKVTQAIGSGDTITPGTNVTQTTVAAQLMELAGI